MEKLLYTGGTGFLGANTMPILEKQYEVTTVGITDRDEIKANFAKEVPVLPCRYDIVLHAAGKAHVNPKTPEEIQSFYDINFQGTVNLCNVRQAIMDRLFFTEARDVFSLYAAGFSPQGQDQLGGKPKPETAQVMQVFTPRTAYLRGTIYDTYTGRSWRNTAGGRRYLWLPSIS